MKSQWTTVGNAGFTPADAYFQSLVVNNGTPYLAYRDMFNANKTTVRYFDGTNWIPLGNEGFSIGSAFYQKLTFYNDTAFVVFKDAGNADKAALMKFNGTNWVYVGNAGISSTIADFTNVFIYQGTPYVSFSDHNLGGNISVMKYDGSNWVYVGTPGFSVGDAHYTEIAFVQDTAVVIYQDNGLNGLTFVKKFDGVNWVTVGGVAASDSLCDSQNLEIINDTIFIAYRDAANGYRATVKKFDGNNWVVVGTPGFTPGYSNYLSFTHENNKLYVAYRDQANANKTSVMYYDGLTWKNLGNPAFSLGDAYYQSIQAFNDTVFVAYSDAANGFKATVMKHVPCILPDVPNLVLSYDSICKNDSAVLYVDVNSNLNSATDWSLYTDSCNGSLLHSNSSGVFTVSPSVTTTYFVKGTGGCVTNSNCSSIKLIVLPIDSIYQNVSGCESSVINGNIYYSSQLVVDTLQNKFGCDSVIYTNLTIYNINDSIYLSGNTLYAIDSTAAYQWMNCDSNTIISGATNQSYMVTSNGNYAVILNKNGCVDTSKCETVFVVGNPEKGQNENILVYPTIVNDYLNILTNTHFEYKIYSLIGTVMLSGNQIIINVSSLKNGWYLLEIKTKKGNYKRKFIKI
ncbi:MAG: hypothetical protein Kow0079_05770 [Vicingaceae bacterium]